MVSGYLANLGECFSSLLVVLLVIAGLTLLAFILDAKMTDRKW